MMPQSFLSFIIPPVRGLPRTPGRTEREFGSARIVSQAAGKVKGGGENVESDEQNVNSPPGGGGEAKSML